MLCLCKIPIEEGRFLGSFDLLSLFFVLFLLKNTGPISDAQAGLLDVTKAVTSLRGSFMVLQTPPPLAPSIEDPAYNKSPRRGPGCPPLAAVASFENVDYEGPVSLWGDEDDCE
ncbi:unnamed protein product [Arctogadus glacialis]